jgi:hypothetical protein
MFWLSVHKMGELVQLRCILNIERLQVRKTRVSSHRVQIYLLLFTNSGHDKAMLLFSIKKRRGQT